MRLFFLPFALLLLITPVLVSAQQQNAFQVQKSDRSEIFVFPYTASNRDKGNPATYTLDKTIGPSWILGITNNQTYAPGNDSKTIIKIQESSPSEKYIEIGMFGGESKAFWVAVNTPDQGFARIYTSPSGQPGWYSDNSISVSHDEAQGLTVTDGKRIVVDSLDLNGFSIGSIAVFGYDGNERTTAPNASSGDITFELLHGSFSNSPLVFVPAAVMIGVGGLVIGLLIFKKRKPEQ